MLHAGSTSLSHNLVGQRLGRKGLETRERIIAATMRLAHAGGDEAITLTSVARAASVGMTTLYLYFPDMGNLLLAVLSRVMEGAEDAFVGRLRDRWPDDRLFDRCLDFTRAHHRFWAQHARILQMRNSCADASDLRFLRYREEVSRPLLDLLIRQMDGEPGDPDDPGGDLAIVMMTGLERIASIVTHPHFRFGDTASSTPCPAGAERLIDAQARLMDLAIRDRRAAAQ